MIFPKPTYKKEKAKGFEEGYAFKDITSLHLTFDTNEGGWETVEASKFDRVFIVTDGLGFGKIQGRNIRLEAETVIEVPAGIEFHMNGQLKYYCITSKA